MLCRMEKAEHGARLRIAMAQRGLDRQAVADAVGSTPRSVTNWTTGEHFPDPTQREALRKMFPGYDDPGVPVEIAIMNSELTEDRRYALVGTYKRMLREQAEGDSHAS
jgi:transcriptional regulator with XRE-family HTH domain